jgi:hypothetical protein
MIRSEAFIWRKMFIDSQTPLQPRRTKHSITIVVYPADLPSWWRACWSDIHGSRYYLLCASWRINGKRRTQPGESVVYIIAVATGSKQYALYHIVSIDANVLVGLPQHARATRKPLPNL